MRSTTPILLTAFLLGALSLPGSAFAQARSPMGAYNAKDYATCARLYGEQADRTPPVRGAAYDAACCLALAGDVEGAFARLLDTPSDQLRRHIAEDADLAPLHDDPRWAQLLERFQADQTRLAANIDHALLEELRARVARDQDARASALEDPRDTAVNEELRRIDADNTAWLKTYLAEHGWPGYDRVGQDGSQGFWLLAQHADQDPAFQEQVLALLEQAVAQDQASGIHLAYLTDRVRLAQGKPQVYGTQFHTLDGKLQPRPIEDAAHVDARRAALGMPTLAEYTALMEDAYALTGK